MEVRIVSKELVKPSSPETTQAKPPHKLCLFDQLTPLTFAPVIQFYSNNHHRHSNNIITHLKLSLSQTLNIYYPFSGTTTPSNLYVHDFNRGLPFTHAQVVNSTLSHFLKLHHNTHLLNLFLPRQPFQRETEDAHSHSSSSSPVMELQVSVFSCGGIALGWAASHKLIDGSTLTSFITTFAAISRGCPDDVVSPNFSLAAELFPPRNPPPQNYINLMEAVWFEEADYVTKRFVFHPDSISRIRSMVGGGGSRVEALSCFIWKRAMAALTAVSPAGEAPRTSILVQAVNMRKATEPPLPDGSIGNVFWWATAAASPESELAELVRLVSESIGQYRSDYVGSVQGESGYEMVSVYFDLIEGLLFQQGEEKADVVAFTSLCGFGFTGHDFGWGKPVWATMMGKVGRAFRNLTAFMDSTEVKGGIEAWVTLDAKRMAVFERDPHLLDFASPNPRVSTSCL